MGETPFPARSVTLSDIVLPNPVFQAVDGERVSVSLENLVEDQTVPAAPRSPEMERELVFISSLKWITMESVVPRKFPLAGETVAVGVVEERS